MSDSGIAQRPMRAGHEVDRTEALALLKILLDDEDADFREGQWEAIEALVNRQEQIFLVQRTGWGKSAVYFLATRLLRDRGFGATLIVSPLLALMRNQMAAAQKMGIKALSINSTNQDEWPALTGDVLAGENDVLLISPERLANEGFMDEVLLPISDRIGLLAVDEAHCISDWGHDFRPDYRRLLNVLQRMPANMPILGTTATANDRVIDDAQTQLGRLKLHRGALMRESLVLQTIRLKTQAERLAWLAERLDELPGSGIIYTLTKRDADQVSAWLDMNGCLVRPYYAGVTRKGFEDSNAYRQRLERALDQDEVKALVATTALGMGYDKPNLGFVVHFQAPSSVTAYYQQVGRAGRATDKAYGIMLAGVEDENIHEYFRSSAFPPEHWVVEVLACLESTDAMSIRELEQQLNLRYGQIEKVLKVCAVDNPAPIIKDGSKWRRTPVAYRMDLDRISRLTNQREKEWEEIQSYIDTQQCLMNFLAESLDDPNPQPCGRCASCVGSAIIDPCISHQRVVEAIQFLRKSDMSMKLKVLIPRGAFLEYGWTGRIRPEQSAQPARLLSTWGDAGWGTLVEKDKTAGRFRDELVEAAEELIVDRWAPDPRPQWVTCVPSMRHPTLVRDFAERLAAALSLPFKPVVAQIKDSAPQKEQRNAFHQCNNLDGVFKVPTPIPRGPVLLVDDVVDSGWTLTTVARLLREAGSADVWPFALARASTGS